MDAWWAVSPPQASVPSSTRSCWRPVCGFARICLMRWWRSERYVSDHCHRRLGLRSGAVVAVFERFSPFRHGPDEEPPARLQQGEEDQSSRPERLLDPDRREQQCAAVDEVSEALA